MSKPVAANFFISSPSEANLAELYQVLLCEVGGYQQAGKGLIRLAEQAHAFRQFDQVREMALRLAKIPIRDYQAIGTYFLAVAANRKGDGDQERARRLFELAITTTPDAYKVKGMLSLAAVSYNQGDFDSAYHYYRETIKTEKLGVASIQAIRGISILKAIAGDHTQAVKDMESALPVIKHAPPHIYFDLLNSYAVELGEVGRLEEARNISRRVLASPFAFAYPEWRETSGEVNLRGYKSRSTVSLTQRITPQNLLRLPERITPERSAPNPFQQPGSVTKLQDWKRKMVKKDPDDEGTDQPLEDMTPQDMAMKLIEIITADHMGEERLRKLLAYALEIYAEPENPV